MTTDRDQVAAIAAQIGSSLMPDNTQWCNRFTVASTSSSAVYTVAQRHSDGTWGCSCRGWTHYRHCKHLTDILGRLARFTGSLEAASMPLDDSTLALLRSARTAFLDLGEPIPVAAPTRRYTRHIDL